MFHKPLRIKENMLSTGSVLHSVVFIVGATKYFIFIMLLEELDPSSLA